MPWWDIFKFIREDIKDADPLHEVMSPEEVLAEENMCYYKPEHFKTQELVDPIIYAKRGEKSLMLLDNRILLTMDLIKHYFDMKSVIVNNWLWEGDRQWSGLRIPESPYYSNTSQHSYGRAIDFYIKGMESKDVRKEIIANADHENFKYITSMEDFDGMSWVHIDCRNWDKKNKGMLIYDNKGNRLSNN